MSLRRFSPALCLLLAVASTASASQAARPSRGCSRQTVATGPKLERTIDIGGVTRKYILHVPANAKPRQPVPLLLDFHGWGHSAVGVWNVSGFKELAERDGFITVYPDGLPVRLLGGESRPGWEIAALSGNRDIAFTKALLDLLENDYCIDRARVYSTGFSNGAFFSHILGCVLADRIAAIAPVGGGQITVPCTPGRPVSVLIYHGIRDDLIPLQQAQEARDQWAAIDRCGEPERGACDLYGCAGGTQVRYCEVDLGHNWPPQATVEIWGFLRRYALPESAPTEGAGAN